MSIHSDNAEYEAWLRSQGPVVEKDIEYKHRRMRKSAFIFLRATFFRWARQIEAVCSELKDAPRVVSVGDAHLENFGTWRDAEGRWVWGINDFDEAARIPYPFDLVRLVTSARLAPGIDLDKRDAAKAVFEGYRAGLRLPRPTLLDEQATRLRPYVALSDKDREKFWQEVEDYPAADPPTVVMEGLRESLPRDASIQRFASRVKGGGSLGRPRYVAIAFWNGGRIAREAKALVPSAWDWAHGTTSTRSRFLDLGRGAFRSPDPFLDVHHGFVFRRIAADSRKIEFDDNSDVVLEAELLRAMGYELGSIHAADRRDRTRAIEDDLAARPPDWLHQAARRAQAAVEADFEAWKA